MGQSMQSRLSIIMSDWLHVCRTQWTITVGVEAYKLMDEAFVQEYRAVSAAMSHPKKQGSNTVAVMPSYANDGLP
jgi:hypothetical protein